MEKLFKKDAIDSDLAHTHSLVAAAFSCAYLCKSDFTMEKGDFRLVQLWLKAYRQTPHESPEQTKPPDLARYLAISPLRPLEFEMYKHNQETSVIPYQEQSTSELYVYNNEKTPLSFEQYLKRYYEEMMQEGWSLGLTPIGLFHTINGPTLARCMQLDLETSPSEWSEVLDNMTTRKQVDPEHPLVLDGYFSSSSDSGTHYHSHAYFPCNSGNLISLVTQFGSILLLNKEGAPPVVDARSIGHTLRSLRETDKGFPPDLHRPETSSLRIVRSRMKPVQPRLISSC